LLFTGTTVTPQQSVGWGAAGFVATGLAPAMGMAPELPGMIAAEVSPRQLWWVFTAVATAASLFILFRPDLRDSDKPAPALPALHVLVALAILAAPHVIGAPQAPIAASGVPAQLAAKFSTQSLGVQAIMWIAAAAGVGYFWQVLGRFDER
jgi:predicted cobalt transporter CbtA